MDNALQTMIDNLHKNTGKSLEEWIKIVKKENFEKHGQIVKFLKSEHGFTHGFANLVAHKSKESDSDSISDKDALLDAQYKGKESLRPIYDKLISEINKFGNDIDLSTKKAYMSLRRNKQFATLKPATKSRFEIGLNIKGQESEGILQKIDKANSMCSHQIDISSIDEVNEEVVGWLKEAYLKGKG